MKGLGVNIVGGIIVLVIGAFAAFIWDQALKPLYESAPVIVIAFTGVVVLCGLVAGFLIGNTWRVNRTERQLGMTVEEAAEKLQQRELRPSLTSRQREAMMEILDHGAIYIPFGSDDSHLLALKELGFVAQLPDDAVIGIEEGWTLTMEGNLCANELKAVAVDSE